MVHKDSIFIFHEVYINTKTWKNIYMNWKQKLVDSMFRQAQSTRNQGGQQNYVFIYRLKIESNS
jgi:hypothetical protein